MEVSRRLCSGSWWATTIVLHHTLPSKAPHVLIGLHTVLPRLSGVSCALPVIGGYSGDGVGVKRLRLRSTAGKQMACPSGNTDGRAGEYFQLPSKAPRSNPCIPSPAGEETCWDIFLIVLEQV